ncbi:MAG: hypothetical protein WC684_08250 [Hyphomicrobium sp.]
MSAVLDRIGERPKIFVLDFTDVPLVDSTAAKALEGLSRNSITPERQCSSPAPARVCGGPCSPPVSGGRMSAMPLPPRMRWPKCGDAAPLFCTAGRRPRVMFCLSLTGAHSSPIASQFKAWCRPLEKGCWLRA